MTSTIQPTSQPARSAAARTPEALRQHLDGQVITPDSDLYDQARRVHDLTVDRRPKAIVRAATAQDVATAVRFARETGQLVAVRSGGHSVGRHSMIDGAVVIDVSQMKGISIDQQTGIARVQTGATSGDLAGPAHAYGRALSTGDTSSVGLGGLATGGGIGFMVRKYGLTVDNIRSAQVVTANGDILTASDNENPDLFWAVRGGGGNFGVVTELELQLAPVGQVLGGCLMLPATRDVVRGYLDYVATAPDDLTTLADIMLAPPEPFVPEDKVGQPVISILVIWTGGLEDGERAIAPLRALAEPVADMVEPIPYPAMYNFTAPLAEPHAFALRSMFAHELSDEMIDASLDAIDVSPEPVSLVHLRGLGGAMARVPADATAFAHRDKPYFFAAISVWLDANEDPAPHRDWVEQLWAKVKHEGDGVYVNFLGNEGYGRIREAYPDPTFARLVELKRKYDPDNVFRFNQNIRP